MTASPIDTYATEVRQFRQILFWPLQLMPASPLEPGQQPWEALTRLATPWREVPDAFAGDPSTFPERHYAEFVTFLPYVQRFLYGEAPHRKTGYGESPITVFSRDDIARARVTLDPGSPPIDLEVTRAQLYFFVDIEVVIPVLEVTAQDLDLTTAEDLLFRFGRAYPASWQADGQGSRCPALVEWIGRTGEVLARSDYDDRARYLGTVAHSRLAAIASHWVWFLLPLLPEHSEVTADLRYRQLEYYRMPIMGYLSFDDPGALHRADFIRLAVGGPSPAYSLPFSSATLARFEEDFCYDRFWAPAEPHEWANTRFICTGHTFLVIGEHGSGFFTDAETGVQGQFERQYFVLGLLAHFHKAALLMLSDRLVVALSRLDLRNVESIKKFKRTIRRAMATFLGFTHRYWFHEISTQDQARELFLLWRKHLDTDRLFAEVREEIQDMNEYLNSDSLRRQANTVVRLTVVTTLGLIGTIATGILGMNIFASADQPWHLRVLLFILVLIPTLLLTFYTVSRSRKLADFLERLSEGHR